LIRKVRIPGLPAPDPEQIAKFTYLPLRLKAKEETE